MSLFLNNKIDNLFYKILNFFFILFPFFILSGPFLPDFAITFSSIIFIFYLIYNKKLSFLYNRYFLLFMIYCLFLIIVSLFSNHTLNSLESSLFYFRFGIFIFAVRFAIEKNNKILKYFTISLTAAFTIGLLYGYIYYLGDFNKLFFNASYSRIPLPFTDEFILGSFFARLFPLFFCLYLYFFNSRTKYIYILSVVTILSDILIYISGERTAFALITLSIFLLILSLDKFRKIRIFTLFISIFLIIFITIFNSSIKDRMVSQTLDGIYDIGKNDISDEININNSSKLIDSVNSQNLDYGLLKSSNYLNSKKNNTNQLIFNKFNLFSDAHNALANSAIYIYIDNNKLIGIGPKLFRIYCKNDIYLNRFGNDSCSTHPHHTYLQLLVETGLLGMSFILILFFYACFNIVKHIYYLLFKKQNYLNILEIGAFISIIISLCPIVPSGSFFNNWLNSIYFLPFIFLFNSKVFKK